jgi:quercetin dioxygenase-like cupin family protein
MNIDEFKTDLIREGYQPKFSSLPPGQVAADHIHDFDARVMVLGGEITITRDGKPETFRVGDSCMVPAGYVHAENVGPEGVAYLAGRRAGA